jgi:hypothetical protein
MCRWCRRRALEDGDFAALVSLMNRNFSLRRQMYGDANVSLMGR